MSNIPGYNPSSVGVVSYPSTYQGVRTGFSQNVPTGNVTFRAQPGAGRGKRRGKGSNLPKSLKVFTCTGKHPIAALKELRADAQFEVICTYMTQSGAAIVVNTTIDGVVYQGEGTSGQIARTIAAHKALMGMNASDHSMLKQVVDFQEQKKLVMERIEIWQQIQEKKEKHKAEQEKAMQVKAERKLRHEQMQKDAAQRKEERKAAAAEKMDTENDQSRANKKKKKNNGAQVPVAGQLLLDYGYLIQKYGPDVSETTTELTEKTELGCFQFRCVLVVQGSSFESTSTSKKGARNQAVALAHAAFAANPPPVVNEKRKLPQKHRKLADDVFTPLQPVEFQDKLAEKCWTFVTNLTASMDSKLKVRRNLVVIVKVEGSDELENCEIVSFGNGTLLIKRDNMTTDGTSINDSTAESLALRAFRRYLIDQLELCYSGKSSVYVKNRSGGKCSIRRGVKFYLYTNSCPMGDCRAVELEEKMETSDQGTVEPGTEQMQPVPAVPAEKISRSSWAPKQFTPSEELGKITYPIKHEEHGSSEVTSVFSEKESHVIPSPSDKLAVRQVCGVQGSMLFNLSNPVYISHYFINRSFNHTALHRAIWGRVNGKHVPTGNDCPAEPKFTRVSWKATKMVEKRTKWALVWVKGYDVEVISTPHGKQYFYQDVKEHDPDDKTKYFAPSRFCSKEIFNALVNTSKTAKKTYPQKYAVAKAAGTKYRQLKVAVLKHLNDNGYGEWVTNPCKPDY